MAATDVLTWDNTHKRTKRKSLFISECRAGQDAVSSSAVSVAVVFSTALPNTNYSIVGTLINLVDANPQFQPVTITAFTTAGFTASWNAPADSGNYSLNWQAIAFL